MKTFEIVLVVISGITCLLLSPTVFNQIKHSYLTNRDNMIFQENDRNAMRQNKEDNEWNKILFGNNQNTRKRQDSMNSMDSGRDRISPVSIGGGNKNKKSRKTKLRKKR